MNWTQFFMWMTGAYVVYYLIVFIADISGNKGPADHQAAKNQLTFSEVITPRDVDYDQETGSRVNGSSGKTPFTEPEVIGSGGVLLRNLFNLARKEVVVYTKQVSY